MDDRILRRLDCLSKKQLLAAIRAMTDGHDAESAAVRSLATYLDTIEPAPGSNRKVPIATSMDVTTDEKPEEDLKAASSASAFDFSKYATSFFGGSYYYIQASSCIFSAHNI